MKTHLFFDNQEYLINVAALVERFLDAQESPPSKTKEKLFQVATLHDYYQNFTHRTPPETDFPLEVIRRTFGLDEFGFFCLMLGYASQSSPSIQRRCATLQGTPKASFPVLHLAFQLWGRLQAVQTRDLLELHVNTAWSSLLFGGETHEDIFLLPIRLSDSVMAWIQGSTLTPAPKVCALYQPQDIEAEPPVRAQLFAELTTQCEIASRQKGHTLFHLSGADGAGKTHLVRHLAATLKRPVLVLDYPKLANLPPRDVDYIYAQVMTDVTLHGYLLCLKNYLLEDEMSNPKTVAPPLLQLATADKGITFITSGVEGLVFADLNVATYVVELDFPRGELALAFWQALSKSYTINASLEELASTFLLQPQQILNSLQNALMASAGADTISKGVLQQAILKHSTTGLTQHATPVRAAYRWDDLMLEPDQKDILRRVVDKVRLRDTVLERWGFDKKLAYGRGTSILFFGPPGTGKTMGAQVLAGEIGLALFRVDLSQIMSKYIGETEKNLSTIFNEAKNANVILFFDEADALFSKRSDVKDSKDRYANVETSYLLQKMEEHDGISILATNRVGNFDEAFKRRISYMVGFELPDVAMRLALWKSMFPPEAPLSPGVNFEYLAETFPISGSLIKNIAVNAAYLAATDGKPIAMVHLIQAIKSENLKAGKVSWASEFGQYGYLL